MQRIGKGPSKPPNDPPSDDCVERSDSDSESRSAKKPKVVKKTGTITPVPPPKTPVSRTQTLRPGLVTMTSKTPVAVKILQTEEPKGKGAKHTPEVKELGRKLKILVEMSERLQQNPPPVRATMLLADWQLIPDPEGKLRRAIARWEEETTYVLTQVWLNEVAIEMNAIIERHELSIQPGMEAMRGYMKGIEEFKIPELAPKKEQPVEPAAGQASSSG